MIRFVKQAGWAVCCVSMIILIILGIFFPELSGKVFPYRFYNVLTNSMEPEIATNSLVFVKTFHDDTDIKKDDIITFKAERFGEEIIVTHRFSHTEINENGETVYRTHPEQSEILDPYETTEDKILGVCIFHIPFAGKLILFLKSRFGFLWLCQVILILLIREALLAYWKEKGYCLGETTQAE